VGRSHCVHTRYLIQRLDWDFRIALYQLDTVLYYSDLISETVCVAVLDCPPIASVVSTVVFGLEDKDPIYSSWG
jgi:hypothetical protein